MTVRSQEWNSSACLQPLIGRKLPRPNNGRAMAARIPGAELRLFEGGHAFFAQDPAALPAVTAFLARCQDD